MASIIERNGRYLVRVRMQGFKTVTKTFNRKSDGASWGRRVETDMEAGRWQELAVVTPSFREAVQQYRRDVAPKLKGEATYRYRFDEFEALPFAERPVDEVSAADLANWRDQQLQSVKPATVTRKLAMVSSIFTWAARERGWLTLNPMALVRKPRVGDSRTRTLSSDEVQCLLAAARSSKAAWLEASLTVLMHSAMRRSELCGLRRGDVDYTQALAHLADTKNGSPRDVPLCPRSLEALRQLDAAAQARGDDLLLPIGPAGSLSTRFLVTVRRARAMYLAACHQAGTPPSAKFLSDIRLHDLRHHAVTAWSNSGVLSVAELMAISGHKSLRMLMRYQTGKEDNRVRDAGHLMDLLEVQHDMKFTAAPGSRAAGMPDKHFSLPKIQWPRPPKIFRGPLLLLRESPKLEREIRGALYATTDVAYSESFVGLSALNKPQLAQLMDLIYVVSYSDLFLYYQLLTSPKFGVERDSSLQKDLLQFPLVREETLDSLARQHLRKVARRLREGMVDWDELDELVFELHGLTAADGQLVRDTLEMELPFTDISKGATAPTARAERLTFCDSIEKLLMPFFAPDQPVRVTEFLERPIDGWVFIEVGAPQPSSEGFVPAVDLADLVEFADSFWSSRIVIKNEGRTIYGLLDQRRYWTRTEARTLALGSLRVSS